eukprot:TRINITY_DN188_c0_g2_i1.p1 TRINITY_DN188_c0_g2~~TRINITY_DN188_c0_g2_i1.p1  ORF type:complete len:924 (-),score=69.62 TRINITY_DN188_c0_g2_i1:353-2872(-)
MILHSSFARTFAYIVLSFACISVAQNLDDLDPQGACKAAISTTCKDIQVGAGNLADCLTTRHEQERLGKAEGAKVVIDDCKKELIDYWVKAGASYEGNKKLQERCRDDAQKLQCLDGEKGQVIACLRNKMSALSQQCAEEITLLQEEATLDYRIDIQLRNSCETDVKQVCPDVPTGQGQVQKCLRDNLSRISWECRKELERQEFEDASDIRLSTRLYKACFMEKKNFCDGLPAGNGRIIQCLVDNKSKPSFSAECAAELVTVVQKRMSHLQMDPFIKKFCQVDIKNVCGVSDTDQEKQYAVLNCLQDLKDELQGQCKEYIDKLTAEQFEDIRLDIPLLNACQEDRETYCSEIPVGSARVIHCLQENRKKLSSVCKATLFDQEVKMAEDIDFKFVLKQQCSAEIARFCSGVPNGKGRIIKCLGENMNHVEFSKECKKQLNQEIQMQSEDYRLNYRLKTNCKDDIDTLCTGKCTEDEVCGGVVLQCLSEKMDAINKEECYNEVFYFVKMEVSDFRNDITLAENCRTDVDRFCSGVEAGEGRVHKCLRSHLQELSDSCKQEELKLMQIQSRDVRLQPNLMKACQAEMYMFCLRISPGGGRVFKCLQKNLGQPDFGADCAKEVQARTELMQSDYRFDYGVKSHCENSVNTLCSKEASGPHKKAIVLNCLISNYQDIDEDCSTEVTRAVRMALWTYKAGAAITGVCDADVNTSCAAVADKHKRKAFGIGVVGRCLSRRVAESGQFQSQECKHLVTISAPKDIQDMFLGGDGDNSLIVEKLRVIEQKLGGTSTLLSSSGGNTQISGGGWVFIGTVVVVLATVVALVMVGLKNVFSKTVVVKNVGL